MAGEGPPSTSFSRGPSQRRGWRAGACPRAGLRPDPWARHDAGGGSVAARASIVPAPSLKAAIVGIAGPTLSADEAALFRAYPPAGVILFARNIEDPGQLAALVGALRRALPARAVLMVDQEGGRVARLRPPHWRAHPSAATIGALFARRRQAGLRVAWLTGVLIGHDCAAAGFDVAAAPVLDLAIPGAHAVIGDRALAEDPVSVARLGRPLAVGLLAAGIQPVGKHAPGHGRARVDSHFALPRVAANHLDADLLPFALNTDLPWAMSAHIVYPAWDAVLPATLSPTVIAAIIRGRIGFGGVLVTDDLAMKALSGTPADLARQALAAGCDISLFCSGEPAPTAELLRQCPPLTEAAAARLTAARSLAVRRRLPLDAAALSAERDRLLA
jgi:beta-N-acetylhexosaminidase